MSDDLAMMAAARLATLVERYAPGLLVGLHLVGSVVDGDFHPGRSDLDFVAVLSHPPDEGELGAIGIVHRSYAADSTLPMLDGIWITGADLVAGPDAVADGPTSHDNRFAYVGRGNRNPVTWAMLRRGRSVVGTLDLAAMWWDRARLQTWVRQNVEEYWAPWIARANPPLSLRMLPGSAVMWGVLGISRMLYTLRTGEVSSKREAGEWVLGVMQPRWRAIVEEALTIRRTGRGRMGPLRRRREALAFMAMLLDVIRSPQPASE